jgi:4-hydroxy-tetrahydrodipicolinate reductase
MGRRIIALGLADRDIEITGAIESKGHPAIGEKLSQALQISAPEITVGDSPEVIRDADVLIDFTHPLAAAGHLASAVKYKKAVVIGTTGLGPEQVENIRQASADIPVVFSPNMSLGVNIVFKLVRDAAQKLGADYKVDIVEAHHTHKKDAPSGTAKQLAELVKQAPGREKEKIHIDSVREGEIVGDHQVRFNGPQDTIIIKHSAKTRDIFAKGALEAARFAAKQKPGLYDMQDVIKK